MSASSLRKRTRGAAAMQVRAALLAIVLCAASLVMGSPAAACSLAPGYRVPTTLELVERADAIALVRVERGAATEFGRDGVRLVPVEVLKGSAPLPPIRFEDTIIAENDIAATPSDPRNLVDANPDAFSGSCNRYLFSEEMLLVAFLRRDGAALVPDSSPFARTLEDVPSPDALWVKAVRMYLALAALPPAARKDAMIERRNSLSLELDDPDARLLAIELDRALGQPR